MEILYKPTFIRQFSKVEKSLQEEILEKIELFKQVENHDALKVHKLKGHLKDCCSFSVNYKIRIVFSYEKKNCAVLLALGDHDVYK
jgi:mRNA-degrading endonuclease YafQ of YafQ-DinJ toxin-antitoxin module